MGTVGCGPRPLGPLLWERLQKGTQNGRQIRDIFDDISSFCRKWQTAFGLRLCSRIRVRAHCFHSLGFIWWPFICSLFVNVFWAQPGTSKSSELVGSAVEAASPYLTSRTTLLFTCTSCPRWWPSTCSLVGSSLEPAAGFLGSASAADPFFCLFVLIIYGIWDDLLCAIGFALKFCIRLIGRNVISVICVFFMFFATWDVLNHAFLIQMAAYGSICTHTNAYRHICKLFSCIFMDFHWFSLVSGGFEAIRARRLPACGSLWERSPTPLR